MVGVWVAIEKVLNLIHIFNCKGEELPMKYLSLPLGANPRPKNNMGPNNKKIKERTFLHAKTKKEVYTFPIYGQGEGEGSHHIGP